MQEEDSQWRRELWSVIIERLGVQDPILPLPTLEKQKQLTTQYHQIYYNSHMTLYMEMTSKNLCIALWIQGENMVTFYDILAAQRSAIEEEVGTQLDWQPKPGQKSRSVILTLDIDTNDAANREKIIVWFYEHVPSFYRAFRVRIDTLAASCPI